MALSKAAVLRHKGVYKTKEVHVPEWVDENGDDVLIVRGMSLKEFELNQASADDGESAAKVLVRCILVDASTGERMFTDANVDDVAALPVGGALKVNKAIMELSGLMGTPDEGESVEDKAIADAEGNSEPTGDVFSSSDSQNDSDTAP